MSETSSLSQIFRVWQKPYTLNTDTRFNIIKRRELVLFKTSSNKDNINLAYCISKKITSENNMFISDRSYDLPENTIPEDDVSTFFTGLTTNITTDRFLVTDVIVTDPSAGQTPVYLKHIANNFDSTDTNLKLTDIVILDQKFNHLDLSEISVDLVNGIIYNNLENKYDFNTGEYTVYFVRYSVKNISTGITISYTDILNNIPAFRLATFDDLDSGGNILAGLKVYILDEFSASSFEVRLPIVAPYAIKPTNDSRIALIKPPISTTDNPWFVSVRNSKFFAAIETSPSTVAVVKYNVPEFASQTFNPYSPYKLKNLELSTRINKHLIKVAQDTIQLDYTNFNVVVTLRNIDGTARKAFNTDSSQIGLGFEDITITDGIRSVDTRHGIIDLLEEVKDTDTIETTYYYIEKEIEYIDVDFNPVSNRDLLNQRYVFYMVPNTADSRGRTIYHLVIDSTGKILMTNQPDDSDLITDISTNNFFYDAIPSGSPTLNFLDKYTVQASSTNQFANPSNPKYFVLGTVYTRENSHPQETTIIDIRKEGGGIKPENIEDLLEDFPQVLWTTNTTQWGGQPYPGRSSFLIEVPNTIQTQFEGSYNDLAIRQTIETYSAFGSYPVIRGYHVANPDVSIETFDTSITLTWRSMGPYNYNVYYSLFEDHGFILANTTPLIDDSTGNTYAISDIMSGTEYFIYVVVTDEELGDLPPTIITNG